MEKNLTLKDYDLAFIDAEMTGRGFVHELTELAVLRVSSFNFTLLDEWVTKIKPRHIELAEPEALAITHYSEEDWKDALDIESALKLFLVKTENTILVGHNVNNDWFYLYKSLAEFNLNPTFSYRCLDTVSLAWAKLRNEPNIRRLSLRELAEYYGIKLEKAHSALDDARITYKIFLELIK